MQQIHCSTTHSCKTFWSWCSSALASPSQRLLTISYNRSQTHWKCPQWQTPAQVTCPDKSGLLCQQQVDILKQDRSSSKADRHCTSWSMFRYFPVAAWAMHETYAHFKPFVAVWWLVLFCRPHSVSRIQFNSPVSILEVVLIVQLGVNETILHITLATAYFISGPLFKISLIVVSF